MKGKKDKHSFRLKYLSTHAKSTIGLLKPYFEAISAAGWPVSTYFLTIDIFSVSLLILLFRFLIFHFWYCSPKCQLFLG